MKPKRPPGHIAEKQPANVRAELERGLLGRWLSRGAMEARQHEIAGREVRRDPRLNLNPRPEALTKLGDPHKLRGVPLLVKGGVGSAIAGTDPLAELLRKERDRERRSGD